MADWLQRGEVPDSDDDDAWESQSVHGEVVDGSEDGQRRDSEQFLAGSPRNTTPRQLPNTRQDSPDPLNLSYEFHAVKQDTGTELSTPREAWSLEFEDERETNVASDILPNGERGPHLGRSSVTPVQQLRLFPELQFSSSPTLPDLKDISNVNQEEPILPDEISKTYIQLSSPLSSPGLSPSPPSPGFMIPTATELEAVRQQLLDHGIDPLDLGDEADRPRRRNLRQRAPIQLHPFALEMERYKNTLLGRGLKPVRLEQVHEPKASQSQDTDFNIDTDTQIHDFCNSGQTSSPIQLSQPLPSPSVNAMSLPQKRIEYEDDLPDIEQLVGNRQQLDSSNIIKRRKITYAHKGRYNCDHDKQALESQAQKSYNPDIWSLPDSPPTTSSPYLLPDLSKAQLRHQNDNLQAATVSPLNSSPPTLFRRPLGIPTPITSAVKHAVDLTVQDGEADDAADVGSESGASSAESDKSVQVRKVVKRVKGVLPASWLRLDERTRQIRPAHPSVHVRDSQSLSPERPMVRRGVAIPKPTTCSRTPSIKTPKRVNYFGSDDESGDDTLSRPRSFTSENLSDMLPPSDLGGAFEDDRIDEMLPPIARQSKLMVGPKRKGPKIKTKSLFQHAVEGSMRQPKIYDAVESNSWGANSARSKRALVNKHTTSRQKSSKSHPRPPRLSILDAMPLPNASKPSAPAFVRIAARTVRMRVNLGRHSPTRKFIRLDTREDTVDALERLRDWREGIIAQRADIGPDQVVTTSKRKPLYEASGNAPPNVAAWIEGQASTPQNPDIGASMPASLVADLATPTQTTMSEDQGPQLPNTRAELMPKNRRQRPVRKAKTRPAQLETTVEDYSHAYPNIAFRANKKALDVVYRKGPKKLPIRGEVQLAKFLYDDDPLAKHSTVLSSVEQDIELAEASTDIDIDILSLLPARLPRRKKRIPTRLDAGAAKYRQPKEFNTDFLQLPTDTLPKEQYGGKLYGLTKYGTNYTHDFNTIKLPTGVFFHETTFIGSGKLEHIIRGTAPLSDSYRTVYQLGDKSLCWSNWNENVSAELGLCFDSLMETIETVQLSNSHEPMTSMLDCTKFISQYLLVQKLNSFTADAVVRRLHELLPSFSSSLASWSSNCPSSITMLPFMAEFFMHHTYLVFQCLAIARHSHALAEISFQLESLLCDSASLCIDILLYVGFESVRELCEDLQYLSFREAGIRSDQYAAQSWVSLMLLLREAKIPRVSFWEVFNSRLLKNHTGKMNDARTLEQIWYSLFSLLPLTGFDLSGVLKTEICTTLSLANWSLIVRLAKNVFQFYTTSERQSASFNDYCRAMFARVYVLMDDWGWRQHGSVVGPLFDFFASQKLAYLRNEPLSGSPIFLQGLDQEPDLSIEPRDVSFHILLKTIALSFKHMSFDEDIKSMRNIVTRLLPNHDRQYPKEEVVLESDLASLRNHHDILCTLFWAAPMELRPSVSLIRDLVNPERSHKAAYLINLCAWSNLVHFVLSTTQRRWPSTPNSAQKSLAYEPFAVWQAEAFTQLLELYHSAADDVQSQLNRMSDSSRNMMAQETIDATIRANKAEIMDSITRNLDALRSKICNAESMDIARLVFANSHFQGKLLNGCLAIISDLMLQMCYMPRSTESQSLNGQATK